MSKFRVEKEKAGVPEKWPVKEPAEVAVGNGVNKKSEISSRERITYHSTHFRQNMYTYQKPRVVYSYCCVVGYYLRVPISPLSLLAVSWLKELFKNTVKFQVSFRMVDQPSQLREKTKQNKTKRTHADCAQGLI